MQFSVKGVSNTGNAADIPEGSYWKVSDETLASIDENGLFTAVATGDVTVQFIVNGEVAGEKIVSIIVPDDIKFVEDRITAIYGEPKKMDVTVWYQGYPVAFTPLKDAFVFFDYEFDQYGNPDLYFTSDAGYINGLEFVGSDAKKVRTVTVYAAMIINGEIIGTAATVNLYYKDEATFDFANATMGNRSFAWIRDIENARTLDNQLYRVSDPDAPIVIDYTFGLDMTAIDFPAQLEPMKSMLPTYTENATAWDYLLQLAERVCTQTSVTIKAEFSKDLDVDISELKILTEYFTPTTINLDENNVLTIVCNWVNRSQPIDPATANSLCILTGLKATVKDTAAYYDNKIAITNNGTVSYDIYLAASSLYSFAQDAANQAQYGLIPYIHLDDCRTGIDFSDPDNEEIAAENKDKGAHFVGQYVDFADAYVISTEVLNGWHEEGKDYYYYVNNVPVTGTQLVTDRHDATQDRFYEFDETGKLVNEQGYNGLVEIGTDLYYAVLGVAQKGWQVVDGNNYYFHPDTGKAVDGVYKIKENANSWTTNWYTYTFEDHVLVLGDMVYETESGVSGWRYRWAGAWASSWFDADGKEYYAGMYAPYFLLTGYSSVHVRDSAELVYKMHLFDEYGVFQSDYNGIYKAGNNTYFIEGGIRANGGKLYRANDGHYYFTNPSNATIYTNHTEYVEESERNNLLPVDSYHFDSQGRLTDALVEVENNVSGVTASVMGKVTTVTAAEGTPVCKVGYKDGEKYVTIEATLNSDGTYNFAAPTEATDIKIVISGDADGSGTMDATDIAALKNEILEKTEAGVPDVNEAGMLAGDVNGDGKVTALDLALINAALKNKIDLKW